MQNKLGIFLSTFALFLASPKRLYSSDSCLTVGRDTTLCYRMKHLRSCLNILDSQRDLMRTNFKLIEETAFEMEELISLIQSNSHFNRHLEKIGDVKLSVQRLKQYASQRDLRAFQVANEIHSKCQNCHSNAEPSSGVSWNDLSLKGWDRVTQHCNASGRNPYICKQMHGMATHLAFFETSDYTGVSSYQMVEQVAEELYTQSGLLAELGFTHDVRFEEVKQEAGELKRLSQAGDPSVYIRAEGLRARCTSCHQ